MPRATPATTKRKRLLRYSYESLLKIVRHGREVIDPRTGQYARDENGELIYSRPTAADVNAAGRMAKELESAIGEERVAEERREANIRAQLKKWKPDEHQVKRVLVGRGWTMGEAVEILKGPQGEAV